MLVAASMPEVLDDGPNTSLIGWRMLPTLPKVLQLQQRNRLLNVCYVVAPLPRLTLTLLAPIPHWWKDEHLSEKTLMTSSYRFDTRLSLQVSSGYALFSNMRKTISGRILFILETSGMADGRPRTWKTS
jgi:hypothetical protein